MFIMFFNDAKMNFDFRVSNDDTRAKKNSIKIDIIDGDLTSCLLTNSQKNIKF